MALLLGLLLLAEAAAAIEEHTQLLQKVVQLQRHPSRHDSSDASADAAEESHATTAFGHPSWLSECTSIYLDLGSNLGVQVRKMFEPEKYPRAKITKAFNNTFGHAEHRALDSGLCALGFEPNPTHLPRLEKLQDAYVERGWKVHFYPFAIWNSEGRMEFNVTEDKGNASWDAHLSTDLALDQVGQSWQSVEVRTIDFSEFVQNELPEGAVKLVKMDIEGAEYETLAKMLTDENLCADTVGKLLVEAHPWGVTSTWQGPLNYNAIEKRLSEQSVCSSRGGPTSVSWKDDETYLLDVDSDFSG